MTLAQMGVVGAIYHIRMDHQPPSHFSALPPLHLSPQSLKRYNELPPPPYSEVMQGGRSAVDNEVGGARIQTTPEGKTSSDVCSMSVGPGSVDDQLSSQGSWGISSDGPTKKGDVSATDDTSNVEEVGEGVSGEGVKGGRQGKEVEAPEVVDISNSDKVTRKVSLVLVWVLEVSRQTTRLNLLFPCDN